MKKSKKNVSAKIKLGTVIQTRDENFYGGKDKGYYHPTAFYRKAVVVETNKNDNIGLVKLRSNGKYGLPNYYNGRSKYNPYLEIYDKNGNLIKIGNNFRLARQKGLSMKDIVGIKKNLYENQDISSG